MLLYIASKYPKFLNWPFLSPIKFISKLFGWISLFLFPFPLDIQNIHFFKTESLRWFKNYIHHCDRSLKNIFGIFWVQNWHKNVHLTLNHNFLKFHIFHHYGRMHTPPLTPRSTHACTNHTRDFCQECYNIWPFFAIWQKAYHMSFKRIFCC